jgi:Helix-turn-helix domain
MEVKDEPLTQSIRQTAKQLKIGVNQAYEAAKRGEIPTIRIGKRILVLRKPLKRMLGGGSTSEVA